MAAMDSIPAIWEQIERSESYLVASMYEEAASVATSVLKRICHNNNNNLPSGSEEGFELYDMKVSAGMVLVQSLNQLGRASDILNELKALFISADAIPVQVLRTGACFKISQGSSSGVREFLEEFLSKWHFVDGEHYVLVGSQVAASEQQECDDRNILGVDEYVAIVEIYAVTLLGKSSKDLDLAISWVEKAALPEERRQELLRRLHSMYSAKATNPTQRTSVLPAHHNHEAPGPSSKEFIVSDRSSEVSKTSYLPSEEHFTKDSILKYSRRVDPCFWWFRTINLKFGNFRLAITNRKILLGCLMFVMYYVLRRKQTNLKGIIRRQVLSIKKALVDLWQLTFSYQVNPLAAVQPLPAVTRGSR
ncbi:hypothetical protein JCGZ_22723 [Jatropha curcas]|uniref:Uncharacterized protein n=2 Tax=Jatropha curcas TaxID=180498 RepID=A0A067L3Y2_JATCU|nr:hypothetical protein JCGZ_22723 [Jatropha curcas]